MGDVILVVIVIIFFIAGGFVCAAAGSASGIIVGAGEAFHHVFEAIFASFHFREWTWSDRPGADPARRSYFFGPGLQQLGRAIAGMFRGIADSELTLSLHRSSISNWGLSRDLESLVVVFAWAYYLAGLIVSALLCIGLSLILTLAAGALFGSVSAAFGLVFLIVRLADTLFLRIRRIRADCPIHKGAYRIPAFRCSNPECGLLHRHLIPNAYGVWHHRCSCGTRLPSTFLTGRSRLEAYCPVPGCEAKMVASDARPVVFQLIGGSHAGKSVFLASAVHLLHRQILETYGLDLEIPADYAPIFDQLERWYSGMEPCAKTTDVNSQLYPLLVTPDRGTRRLLSFYDIAGERFSIDARSGDQQQLQLGYCDAILILLDPFSSGDLRVSREQDGVLPDNYSSDRAEDVLIGFVNYLIHLGVLKVGHRYPKPVYVLIAKADEPEVFSVLGPEPMARAVAERSTGENPPSAGQIRDELCMEFLRASGLHEVVNSLDHFETVHYYPVSAMGHPDRPGAPYSPWGIEPLLRDLLAQTDPELSLYLDARPSERRN